MPEMYGDLIGGLLFTASLPLFYYMAVDEYTPELFWGQLIICVSMTLNGLFFLWSWWNRDFVASHCGYASMSIYSIASCYFEWPRPEVKPLLYHFVWHTFMNSANTSMSFAAKGLNALVTMTWTLLLCHISPSYDNGNYRHIILGGTALAVMAHAGVLWSFSNGKMDIIFQSSPRIVRTRVSLYHWTTIRDHAMTIVSLGVFTYFSTVEVARIMLRDGYFREGMHNLYMASFFGAMGLVASGVLREATHATRTTRRAAKVVEQSEMIQLALLALKASHKAMAVVDDERKVILSNPSFQRFSGGSIDGDVLGFVLEDVLGLTGERAKTFTQCFQGDSIGQIELLVRGHVALISVSRASSDMESLDGRNGYIVILEDTRVNDRD